jgi:membrane protease YdiL (CAAX protease family)
MAFLILLAAITIYGYVMPRQLIKRYYTVINLSFGLLTVLFAKIAGVSWTNLGLGTNRLGVVLIITVLVFLACVFTGFKNRLTLSGKDYEELFIRIPIGTALAEELIFRSSLMGILLQNYGRIVALSVSSAVFGLWHILPGPGAILAAQKITSKYTPVWLALASSAILTVIATTAGGLFIGWLRIISAGIFFPWIFHASLNIGGWIFNQAQSQERMGE